MLKSSLLFLINLNLMFCLFIFTLRRKQASIIDN